MRKILILLFVSVQLLAQKPVVLPRSTPEAEGVSSEAIINFLEAASKSKHEFHSFMMLRHGKVVAESWWNPYRNDLKHTMYSVSKSFTATAIGFAVSEKKITVEDKVISFFPDDLPTQVSPYLAELKIKDLLTMSVGHQTDPTGEIGAKNENWVKAFLRTPIMNKPGSKFLYNSAATYMLSAIVQKVTGQKVIDYLQPRLFEPLGITGIDWEVDPKGINTGGWGIRLKTEDMAKFGQLFLQKGLWKGKQILPAAWVEEASTMKIMQDPNATQAKKDSSDWLQGYCYQMWRSRNNGYRGDGANGQFIIVLPEKDVVIIVTAEAPDMQGEFNLLWRYLLPAIKDQKLPANPAMLAKLKEKSASLALPIPNKNVSSGIESKVSGKTFGMVTGDRSFENIKFDFNNGVCKVSFKTDSATHQIPFGAGKWELSETTKFGPYLVAAAKANRVGLPAFKVAGSYTWKDENTLALTLRYIESPHTETIICSFDGDNVSIDFQSIFNINRKRTISKGIVFTPKANAPKLIVRGDDMGYAHSGNEALIKSYKEGIETSIEVIVASPWFSEAVKLLAENKRVDVGLHFAITSEWDNVKWRPLTEAKSLRNADGYFYPMLFHNNNYPKQAVLDNDWKIEDIEKELRAQIEMALKYIPRLSHVSGHMGSTAFNQEVKDMARRVAKEYKLTMVDVDSMKDLKVAYTGFDFNNKNTEQRIEGFIGMLDKLEDGKAYVFVEHPGLDNEELRAISHIGYEDVAQGRQDVTTIFTSEKVRTAILQKGIQLVSYKEVIAGSK
ncbi:ChbG/HpnK family deacetylase [Arcicella lustrica]|uniref:ChbG/HpnK family deacetylase n=1 Tax=Arcicella lustrica TaxID=2984196 RepID=A0ABU5SER7_9BACT|nr:ChbG/HpnK family deacetylase [Arcicella sp. DC25W]MEA5425767.1 ChbG/HpnK family deacetylase [Arcicella sp. DC25W]